jgi:hypothetical protein
MRQGNAFRKMPAKQVFPWLAGLTPAIMPLPRQEKAFYAAETERSLREYWPS